MRYPFPLLTAPVFLFGALAQAAETPPPVPRPDAAEKVQEGNVRQWIEYYQRTRPQAAPPRTEPSPEPPRPPRQ